MIIVFDLDNTLINEKASQLRPGALNLIKTLKRDKHKLILWTNSVKSRTLMILKDLKIISYFERIITREDYDPDFKDGLKDIRKVNGDILIDDNPAQKKYARNLNFEVIIVSSYLSYKPISEGEFKDVYKKIQIINKKFFRKLKKKFFY